MNFPVRPTLLRPDNFTPAERTPWGGRRIVDVVKRALADAGKIRSDAIVGESWEVSVERDFPSITNEGVSLDAIIRADPHAWLGFAAARVASAELLVKLLDAADDLSVQIHPPDDYAALMPGEGGKPESWYVVDASPGACVYLGLTTGVDESRLRAAIREGADVSTLLTRVAVAPGDFFVIEPGMAHAIGRGCLLVEPQRVKPGRKGLTYRFWDWNRRYDSLGRLDPEGEPRKLHVEHALAVTAFDAPRDDAMLARSRIRAGHVDLGGEARLEQLSGPRGPLVSSNVDVARLGGTGALALEPGSFRALTVLEGVARLRYDDFVLDVAGGRSAAIPASIRVTADLANAHALLSAIP